MSVPSRPTRVLPSAPNLEQQKKQARELLDAARAHDPAALARIREHHPRYSGTPDAELAQIGFSLHDAQIVLAREYGFPSWPKLKAHIDSVTAARQTRPFVRDLAYYDERARGLLEILPDGLPSAIEQVRSWHPALSDASDEAIRSAPFTLDDAHLVYARQHGFATWQRFADHLTQLDPDATAEPFMAVFEAGRGGDWGRVRALLEKHLDLVQVRGTNGNTLLNLACSLSPCPPPGAPTETHPGRYRLAAVQLLLAAGADVNRANDRGWTPLHQAGYRNDANMATLLLAAGARIDAEAHGEGGTPLAVALFWGHREVSEVLAATGVVPQNLRIAAGLGRIDLVRACFGPDGHLTPAAHAGRRFYRPHSGFPAWRPSDDPQEILDEALVWAAKADRVEVMPILIERGARLDADPYRGTPLLWAAFAGRVEAARWLLDHGADVNRRATFGGQSHGEGVTALHGAAQNNFLALAQLLVARGADPAIEDAIYHSTPRGWAEHFGATEAQAYLARL